MNEIILAGNVSSGTEFLYEIFGEKFYSFYLSVQRTSGTIDTVLCIVSEIFLSRMGNIIQNNSNRLKLIGEIRTRNVYKNDNSVKHSEIYVFVKEIYPYILDIGDENESLLTGYVCKEPIYRETPLGRNITDLMIASNRKHGKSDYIPCIAWGRNAIKASSFAVGTKVNIYGRLQSREYIKKFDDGTEETRTAYEVSVCRIDLLEDDANENSN